MTEKMIRTQIKKEERIQTRGSVHSQQVNG